MCSIVFSSKVKDRFVWILYIIQNIQANPSKSKQIQADPYVLDFLKKAMFLLKRSMVVLKRAMVVLKRSMVCLKLHFQSFQMFSNVFSEFSKDFKDFQNFG